MIASKPVIIVNSGNTEVNTIIALEEMKHVAARFSDNITQLFEFVSERLSHGKKKIVILEKLGLYKGICVHENLHITTQQGVQIIR